MTSEIESGKGGRRYLPFAFTEPGVAMLSAVLRSPTAVDVSIRIMDAFVEMRRFLAANAGMFDRMTAIEQRQAATETHLLATDQTVARVLDLLEQPQEPSQRIFFDGQIYDAFSFLTDLIGHARESLVLVDGYVDLGTLNLLAKKREGVQAVIWTDPRTRLTAGDVQTFNEQYPQLTVHHTSAFHDRFLVLDGARGYHIGASLKDAGKRSFAVTQLNDPALVQSVLDRLG